MKAAPRREADAENGDRIAEILADNFSQSQLSVGRLNIEIDGQQSQSDQPGYCDEDYQRRLDNTSPTALENAGDGVREKSSDRQEQALDPFQSNGFASQGGESFTEPLKPVTELTEPFSAEFTGKAQDSE